VTMKNKSNFRIFGIGLLISSIFYFVFSSLFEAGILFLMWISGFGQSKEAVNLLFSSIFQQSIYTQIVLFLTPISELIMVIWSLVLAIILIKNNKYNLQIKYFFYFVFINYLAFFILFIPLGNYTDAITNLIIALVVYFLTFWKKGLLSGFVYP
jgi:hypothetical protein